MKNNITLINKIERYLLNAIREKRGKQQYEILCDTFNKIAKITESGEKKETIHFLPILARAENELFKFGYTMLDYAESKEFSNLITNKLEPYIYETVQKDKLVIGIYWIVEERIFLHRQIIDKKSSSKRVDSRYSHFKEWEIHAQDYSGADFATFPRGRIMFDTVENQHIIFADKCVTEEQIEQIVGRCYIKKYKIEYDEHYRCDRCLCEGIYE